MLNFDAFLYLANKVKSDRKVTDNHLEDRQKSVKREKITHSIKLNYGMMRARKDAVPLSPDFKVAKDEFMMHG